MIREEDTEKGKKPKITEPYEHELCKGCKWNDFIDEEKIGYPHCKGTILTNGKKVRIDYLLPFFRCGIKESDQVFDMSLKKSQSSEDVLLDKITQLENRLIELEKSK